MDKEVFKEIVAEFSAEFQSLKELAEEIRDILFPYREGLFTGTYRDPERLYKLMIDTFERAIASYRVVESE